MKRLTIWIAALASMLVLAAIAAAAAPKLSVAASYTYPQAGSGTAWICVKVKGPPKTVLVVKVSGASVLGAKTKTKTIGAKGVIIVKFQTNTPAGYDFLITGRLGTSAKSTKRAMVNVPQPGETETKSGTFSCV
jgi:glyoxylate carboligase